MRHRRSQAYCLAAESILERARDDERAADDDFGERASRRIQPPRPFHSLVRCSASTGMCAPSSARRRTSGAAYFIGCDDFVPVSLGALVFVNGGFGSGIDRYQLHFIAAGSACNRDGRGCRGRQFRRTHGTLPGTFRGNGHHCGCRSRVDVSGHFEGVSLCQRA
jgi:hypothetical protein